MKIPPDQNLCGTWRSPLDNSSDYYGAEYEVSLNLGEFLVSGLDTSDSEVFEISDVFWNGLSLTFHSFIPSTQRCCINQLRYLGEGEIEFLFTFIEREVWARKQITKHS